MFDEPTLYCTTCILYVVLCLLMRFILLFSFSSRYTSELSVAASLSAGYSGAVASASFSASAGYSGFSTDVASNQGSRYADTRR